MKNPSNNHIFILVFFTSYLYFIQSPTFTTSALSIRSLPSSLHLNQVSQSYPSTVFRTLFSSVPKREFAIQNITINVESELVVIVGASSSGKSTIVRLVSKQEEPISGSIRVYPPNIRPVYLEQGKSPFQYERSKTVSTILENACVGVAVNVDFIQQVISYVCDTVGLTSQELQSTPSELSPSSLYRFHLAKATLESILPALNDAVVIDDNDDIVDIPSPLLLLDEWFDLETSSIVHRVQESLLNLTQHGAVVMCITHKPKLLKKSTHQYRTVTMCRGEILNDDKSELVTGGG